MVTAESLKAKRKWAIVIAFIVAAILTPPDPISMSSFITSTRVSPLPF